MSGMCVSGIGVSGVCESNLCSSLWYKKILSLTFSAFRCLLFNKNPYFIKSVWDIHFEEHRINTAGQKQWNVQAKIKVLCIASKWSQIQNKRIKPSYEEGVSFQYKMEIKGKVMHNYTD